MQYIKLFFLISLFPCLAFAGGPLKVLVVDTGVDGANSILSQVFCPAKDSLDATSNKKGIPDDSVGHGTHVAGIIRALAGPRGYCLAFCKYYLTSNSARINLSNTVRCIKHARSIGATLVNYSSGGSEFNEEEKLAIQDSPATILVAAGNEHRDIDEPRREYYPAAYHLPNEIIVGSVDSVGARAATSNYGKGVVPALGENVYSALPDGVGYMGGTSMATAVYMGTTLRRLLGLPPIGSYRDCSDFLWNFWRVR